MNSDILNQCFLNINSVFLCNIARSIYLLFVPSNNVLLCAIFVVMWIFWDLPIDLVLSTLHRLTQPGLQKYKGKNTEDWRAMISMLPGSVHRHGRVCAWPGSQDNFRPERLCDTLPGIEQLCRPTRTNHKLLKRSCWIALKTWFISFGPSNVRVVVLVCVSGRSEGITGSAGPSCFHSDSAPTGQRARCTRVPLSARVLSSQKSKFREPQRLSITPDSRQGRTTE